jgi:nuclear transcription factor Y gamma
MKIDEGVMLEMERERRTQEEGNTSENIKNTRFMIAGEGPVLLGKACELMIKEITTRAWRHTERNRRRTLQKQDVHAAVGESEVYDFLIDIVPRVTTSQPAPPLPSYPDQSVTQAQQTMTVGAVAAPVPPGPEMNVTEVEHFPHQYLQQSQQVQQPQQQIDPSLAPPGYEHYYMQMHQSRMQAEASAAAAPSAPGAYMTPAETIPAPWTTAPMPSGQQGPAPSMTNTGTIGVSAPPGTH